jgi:serine protease inhibitor
MANLLSESNNSLGWDMLIELCSKEIPAAGCTVSPLSVNFALAMLAGGAPPETQQTFCAKMGLAHPEELNTRFSQLLAFFSEEKNATLSIANAVFADQSFTVFPGYANHLEALRASVKADFPSLVEGTEEINAWIAGQTLGMIQNMLSRLSLQNIHVALVNALAFKGNWQAEFDPQKTDTNYKFHITHRQTRRVRMMFAYSQKVLVHWDSNYTAVRLPYSAPEGSPKMSFIAYLPKPASSVQEILPEIRRDGVPTPFKSTKLDRFGLPKFKIDTKLEIFRLLETLQYPVSGGFPLMGTGPNLVQSVVHATAIDLDEKGTRATAATAVLVTRGRPLNPPPSVIFDRPFAFAIMSDDHDLALFTGVFSVK